MLISCIWMISSVVTAAFSNGMNGFTRKVFDGSSFLVLTDGFASFDIIH
jgi:hypothetical protein